MDARAVALRRRRPARPQRCLGPVGARGVAARRRDRARRGMWRRPCVIGAGAPGQRGDRRRPERSDARRLPRRSRPGRRGPAHDPRIVARRRRSRPVRRCRGVPSRRLQRHRHRAVPVGAHRPRPPGRGDGDPHRAPDVCVGAGVAPLLGCRTPRRSDVGRSSGRAARARARPRAHHCATSPGRQRRRQPGATGSDRSAPVVPDGRARCRAGRLVGRTIHRGGPTRWPPSGGRAQLSRSRDRQRRPAGRARGWRR